MIESRKLEPGVQGGKKAALFTSCSVMLLECFSIYYFIHTNSHIYTSPPAAPASHLGAGSSPSSCTCSPAPAYGLGTRWRMALVLGVLRCCGHLWGEPADGGPFSVSFSLQIFWLKIINLKKKNYRNLNADK